MMLRRKTKSALEVMGDDVLRVIAHELLMTRILRKYGYPPDLQDAAMQTVLQQAEVLSASWQSRHSRDYCP